MLDSLLGRAALKEEIERLESELAACQDELAELERRFEAADQRRQEAVRDRQNAQEEVNRLEDRIAQLEGELERRGSDQEVSLRGRTRLDWRECEEVLATIEGNGDGAAEVFTAMVVDELPEAVRTHFGGRAGLVADATPCLCIFDQYGLMEVALDPPRPPAPFAGWSDHVELSRSWFVPIRSGTFVLVRDDLFARGQCEAGELVDIEGFTSDVQGRHSKGGFSQSRFERRREEQIEAHYDRVRDQLADADPSELIVTGAEQAIDAVAPSDATVATVDASGSPEDALEQAFEQFWTTTLYRL